MYLICSSLSEKSVLYLLCKKRAAMHQENTFQSLEDITAKLPCIIYDISPQKTRGNAWLPECNPHRGLFRGNVSLEGTPNMKFRDRSSQAFGFFGTWFYALIKITWAACICWLLFKWCCVTTAATWRSIALKESNTWQNLVLLYMLIST